MAYFQNASKRSLSYLVSAANSGLPVCALQSGHRCFQQDSSQLIDSQLDTELLVAFDKKMKFGFLTDTWFGSRRIEDTYRVISTSKADSIGRLAYPCS